MIVAEMEARLPEHRSEAQATVEAFMKAPPETASEHRVLGWIAMETRSGIRRFSELGQAMEMNNKDNWARYYLVIAKFREAQATNQSIKGWPTLYSTFASSSIGIRSSRKLTICWVWEELRAAGITSAMQAEQGCDSAEPSPRAVSA